jgi:hypothetical protein
VREVILRSLSAAVAIWLSLAYGLAAQRPEVHWYKGNTHAHTINSDGDSAPDVVARWYREHDYQFLFITDHEYLTDPAPLNALFGAKERFLLLPGQEITQSTDDPERSSAHVNALFTHEVIFPMGVRRCMGSGCGAYAPKETPLESTFATNIAAVLAQGGIAQVNHPNYRWSVKPEDLYNIPDGTLLEIWNGQGHINNLGGEVAPGDVRPSAEGLWDILLSRGKRVWGVGSDDSHEFAEPGVNDPSGAAPGQAWIVVRAPELAPEAIKNAITRGDFYASTGVELEDFQATPKQVTILMRDDDYKTRYRTQFIGKNSRVLQEGTTNPATYTIKGDEGYVRARITDSNGKMAWTQPVFVH